MRKPERIPKVLKEIQDIWETYPDLRLGQLICNVLTDPALYYIEDDMLISYLKDYYINPPTDVSPTLISQGNAESRDIK